MWRRGKLSLVLLVIQLTFLVLFAVFAEYDPQAHAKSSAGSTDTDLEHFYPFFQDVHVMIFIGFGFLMTFLRKYCFSAVGFNFLLAAVVIQWATLLGGFLHLHDGKIVISVTSLITSDFACATILITFGCMLGKMSPLQMVVMALIETLLFLGNEHIGAKLFQAVDVGGSMFVHAFGAYFGLALSRVLYQKEVHGGEAKEKEGSNYHTDVFAMIGTIFLWMFWPSFNSALAPADQRYRAVINTYYALAACCVTTFALSSLVHKENRLDMVHIQNSTLAGGVAVGTCADMMIQPWGAMIIGSGAGIVSALGFKYLTPFMSRRWKIHDTCGVNNLHGLPGLLAGVCGAVAAGAATIETYHSSLFKVFPARAPSDRNSTIFLEHQEQFAGLSPGDGRSPLLQAGFQLVALVVTVVIAIVGGAITGLIVRWPIFDPLESRQIFDDRDGWETPEDRVEDIANYLREMDTTTRELLIAGERNGAGHGGNAAAAGHDTKV